jgi:hypothetical protein
VVTFRNKAATVIQEFYNQKIISWFEHREA